MYRDVHLYIYIHMCAYIYIYIYVCMNPTCGLVPHVRVPAVLCGGLMLAAVPGRQPALHLLLLRPLMKFDPLGTLATSTLGMSYVEGRRGVRITEGRTVRPACSKSQARHLKDVSYEAQPHASPEVGNDQRREETRKDTTLKVHIGG